MHARWRLLFPFALFLGVGYAQLQASTVVKANGEHQHLRFYLYFGPEWKCSAPLQGKPTGEDYYLATQSFWDRDLTPHPWRVLNPAEADLFIIPFDMEQSYFANITVNNETHLQRVEKVLDTLENSTWYQRRGGADHFWPILRWEIDFIIQYSRFFPKERVGVLKKMIIGRYWTAATLPPRTIDALFLYPKHVLKTLWRCTVTVPIVTPPGLFVEETYEEWDKRRVKIFFRGKDRECHNPRAQLNRNLTEYLKKFTARTFVTNEHAASPEEYHQELRHSKFCLVFACDDPQTSRFYDALAAGCMPIVINDHFRLYVAPFARLLNYDAMTITVSEMDWQADTELAAPLLSHWHEGVLRRVHADMMEMRRALLWHHPHSLVATTALRTVQHECLNWGVD